MKWPDRKWITRLQLTLGVIGVIGLIAFTGISKSQVSCKSIRVDLVNTLDNHFLDEQAVIDMATLNGEFPLEGVTFDRIDLKEVERRLYDHPYVASCETYKDLDGNLLIRVELERPMARIVRESAPDAYITSEGKILPVSEEFVSRVLLMHADEYDSLSTAEFYASENGKNILELVDTISNDGFWKAQLAEMYVDKGGEITFLPQVTRQLVEFGKAEDIGAKLRKLKMFYTEILPVKGWNEYRRVNVEFEDQIIAE